MARRKGLQSTSTRWWVLVALFVFVVVDAVLIVLALQSAGGSSTTKAEVLPTLDPVASQTAEPAETVEPVDAVPAASMVLAAVDATTAYRSVTGECPATPAAVEVSTDGGDTWSDAAADEASAVQSIDPTGAFVSLVARAAEGCEPGVWRTFVQGAEWSSADALDGSWFMNGADVVAPGGAATQPCAASPVQLAAATDVDAAVLCQDATIAVTRDGGAEWSSSQPVAGVTTIAVVPDDLASGVRALVVGQNECEGGQLATLAADTLELGEPAACAAELAAPAALATPDADTAWAWSGDAVLVSTDGGATW